MELSLSEEQQMLRQMARDFLADKCPRSLVRSMEEDELGYSPELWQEIAGLGWTGLVFPEKYQGSGMGFLDLTVLLEEAGRACLPAPLLSSVVLGGLPILDLGTEEQKQKYLPRIASGDIIVTLALTEADGLYEAESMQTKATREGEAFVLKGAKLFVPDAGIADYILCVARMADAKPGTDFGILVVDTGLPGITRHPLKTMAGDRLYEVVFDNVKVTPADLLGQAASGWAKLQAVIDRAALAKCCEMLGGMQQVLEMTVDYAKERKQFDRAIGSFQAIQHYCARMAVDVEGARFGTYRAGWMLHQGLSCRKEIAVAKAFVNEASRRVVALAHQIHGAIGVTRDHDLQLYTRRLKAAQPTFGDADSCREIVAGQMGL